jgi:hypothetical protein
MKDRRIADYYPTPPCMALALRDFLRATEQQPCPVGPVGDAPFIDPSAGAGTLLEWLGVPWHHRFAIELRNDREARDHLQARIPEANTMIGRCGIATDWPPLCHVVMNPPFALAREFIERALGHQARAWREYREPLMVAVLTRTSFWQTKNRRDLPRPPIALMPTWRPSFDGQGNDTFDVMWAVWPIAPRFHLYNTTNTHWLLQPPEIHPDMQRTFRQIQPVEAADLALNGLALFQD